MADVSFVIAGPALASDCLMLLGTSVSITA